jgi:hypothetical protein
MAAIKPVVSEANGAPKGRPDGRGTREGLVPNGGGQPNGRH